MSKKKKALEERPRGMSKRAFGLSLIGIGLLIVLLGIYSSVVASKDLGGYQPGALYFGGAWKGNPIWGRRYHLYEIPTIYLGGLLIVGGSTVLYSRWRKGEWNIP